MDTFEAIKRRRSVREFKADGLSRELLEQIIDAGRFAATARNVQPWVFIAVTEKELLKRLAALADNGRFMAGAGAVVAVFCEDTKYFLEDGCAATQNIMLAACALGIGSCWVAGDKKPYCAEVSAMLGLPGQFRLVSLIALGYPKGSGAFKAAEKKPLKEVLRWEKF
jgi:nitroreductase